jgi:hypothetical protein
MLHSHLVPVLTASAIIFAISSMPNIADAGEPYSNNAYDNISSMLTFSPMQAGADGNTGLTLPNVTFLSNQSEIDLFYKIYGFMNFAMSNSSMGIPNNIQGTQVGSTVYVAWQSNIAGKNHVFLSVSYQGGVFTTPVELTPPDAGNATHLQLKALGPQVSLVWQDDNNVTGVSSIYGALSFDGGIHFVVNKLNSGNTNATDPVLASPVWAFWKQEVDPNSRGDPCGGGGPGPGPGPFPDSSLSGSVSNSTSLSSIQPSELPDVVCGHWW